MQYAIRSSYDDIYIDISGEFTFNDSDDFGKVLRAMRHERDGYMKRNIFINFEHLERIDASAISMLMIANDSAKRRHQMLTFRHPKGQVNQQLRIAAQYNSSMIISVR
ncbi:MAG: STAS domain-containing protein [Alphaproteobacteria bacterium]|nr:STAS domain-containing protein [Alphaproteobacteria bacterium]